MFATRREGDADPAKSIIADTAKLVSNSCFGNSIVDKNRHRRVLYVDGHAAASKIVASSTLYSCKSLTVTGLTRSACTKKKLAYVLTAGS